MGGEAGADQPGAPAAAEAQHGRCPPVPLLTLPSTTTQPLSLVLCCATSSMVYLPRRPCCSNRASTNPASRAGQAPALTGMMVGSRWPQTQV